MSVYAITVNGVVDHFTELDDAQAWTAAVCLVEDALAGGHAGTVEAVPRPGLTVDCNPLIWFNAQTVVDDD